jgi:hypothetical protein
MARSLLLFRDASSAGALSRSTLFIRSPQPTGACHRAGGVRQGCEPGPNHRATGNAGPGDVIELVLKEVVR